MSEKKWREEFEQQHSYLNLATKSDFRVYVDGRTRELWEVWQAANRQYAECIAELEAKLNILAEICTDAGCEDWVDLKHKLLEHEELRAKLDALEKQEPYCYGCTPPDKGVDEYLDIAYSPVEHLELKDWEIRPLYAQPVPATPAIPEGWHDELLLVESVLKGYADGFAKNDALRAVHRLLAAALKPPTNRGEV